MQRFTSFIGKLPSSYWYTWRLQLRWSSGTWQVSSHGRVQSSRGSVSFGSLNCSGYRRVKIGDQSYYVHRLVAAAFLDRPRNLRCWQINHLDGNSSNNHVANLQYVTPNENMKHSWATNSSRKRRSSKLGKAVEWRRQGCENWGWCASQAEAARLLDVWQASISQCCRGLMKKCRSTSTAGADWFEFRTALQIGESAPLDETWRHATYVGDEAETMRNIMVSNHGRVSHYLHGRNFITYGTEQRNGYFAVIKGGRYMMVHRLVAATFLGQPSLPELQVNHKDMNRGNNHVSNLEYVTASENVKHAVLQRTGQARPSRSGKPVQVRLRTGAGAWQAFASMRAAASYTGLDPHRISRLCNGRDDDASWEVRCAIENALPGEEWRPVQLEGARVAGATQPRAKT
ncbi:yosQ [Symbiodinium natans]|uniref:YosQ protein n=1 Tax=Symbiodinium natans TaxID=878477 RepID=A0A812PZI1_9DINO|nr:yosQ [Symbiodinium natans]